MKNINTYILTAIVSLIMVVATAFLMTAADEPVRQAGYYLPMIFGAIGATGGLGWYIFKERTMMHTAGLFAGILLVAVIGMLVEGLVFERLEKRTLRKWSVPAEEGRAS